LILTIVQIDILFYNKIKSCKFSVFISYYIFSKLLGSIKELFLKTMRDNPEIIKKMQNEESDETTKAILKMILAEAQKDPEYSGVTH